VFLPHAGADASVAKKLAAALTVAGLEPLIFEDHPALTTISDNIDGFLEDSSVLVVIWTPEALASKWVQKELSAALNDHKAVSLLIVTHAPMTSLKRNLPSFDVAKLGLDAAISQVVDWVRMITGTPASGGAEPIRKPDDLIGDGLLLDKLADRLRTRPGHFLVYGEPGVGKTFLVRHLRMRLQPTRHVILLEDCGALPHKKILAALIGEMRHLAQQQADPVTRLPASRQGLVARFSGGLDELDRQRLADLVRVMQDGRMVLILDNVGPDDLSGFLPGFPASVVCTSRMKRLSFLSSAQAFELKGFTAEDAHHLLERESTGGEADVYLRDWKALASRVDGSPAALSAATWILRNHGSSTEKLQKMRRFDSRDQRERWRGAVAHLPVDALKLLRAFAVCAPHGSGLPFAAEVAALGDEERREAARDVLVDASLLRSVNPEFQFFRVHALLRDAFVDSDWWEPACDRHIGTLRARLSPRGPDWSDLRRCLGEVPVAARRLLEKDLCGRCDDLLRMAIPQIFHLGEEETMIAGRLAQPGGVRKYSKTAPWVCRFFYVAARLRQVELACRSADPVEPGMPDRLVTRDLERYLELCRKSGDWQQVAAATGILALHLALNCVVLKGSLPKPDSANADEKSVSLRKKLRDLVNQALRLLASQATLYRRNQDFAGFAMSTGLRACFLLKLDKLDAIKDGGKDISKERNCVAEAEKVLRLRTKVLDDAKTSHPLPTLDEDHGYLPQLWEYFLRLKWDSPTAGTRRRAKARKAAAAGAPVDFWNEATGELIFSSSTRSRETRTFIDQFGMAQSLDDAKMSHEHLHFEKQQHDDGDSRSETAEDAPPDRGRMISELAVRWSEAVRFLDTQEDKLIGSGREEELCACYANRAAILRLVGDYDGALTTLKNQERLCRRLDDRLGLEECCLNQSLVLSALGRARAAANMLERKAAIGKELRFEEGLAYANWEWGLLAAIRGDTVSASQYLASAAALMSRLGCEEEQARLVKDLESLSSTPQHQTT
jgi:hypothetical protein